MNMKQFGPCQVHFLRVRINEYFGTKNMARTRNLSVAIRSHFVAIHDAGLNFRQIARQLGVANPLSVILYANTANLGRTKTESVQGDPC